MRRARHARPRPGGQTLGGAGEAPNLPPLKEVIERHGLVPRKALGQNFLLNPRLAAKIVRASGDLAGATVIEVGPGPGGLTRALLAAGVARLIAIERDARCVAALADLAAAYPERLEVVQADALEIDERRLLRGRAQIVANLPYNVATVFLIKWLKTIECFDRLTLMFQREVAARIMARVRSPDYGRLSVMTQWLCEVERLFDVPPGAFVPAPRVTSTLLRLIPRPRPLAEADWESLERVTATAFNQRRKMLRSSLKPLGFDVAALLAEAGIASSLRPQEVGVAGFCALARAWRSRQTKGSLERRAS